MAGYNIKDLYEGGADSFNSGYADDNPDRIFTGYTIPAGELGTTTNPMVANQIAELNKTLNQGVIPVEIGAIDPKVFDVIPKQHFREMGRMAELTGAKISVHAPVQGMEPSGLDPQGRQEWTEQSRRAIEEQLKTVVDKTMDVDKLGGVPITIHASNVPLAEWEKRENPDTGKTEIIKIRDMAINQETGQMSIAERREDYFEPEIFKTEGKDVAKLTEGLRSTMTPEGSIRSMNSSQWRDATLQVAMGLEKADEILRESYEEYLKIGNNESKRPETREQEQAYLRVAAAGEQIDEAHVKVRSLFNKAYKYGDDDEKKYLAEAAKLFSETISVDYKDKKNKTEEEKAEAIAKQDPVNQTTAMRRILTTLSSSSPEQFVSATTFATDKSSETFANVALHSYNEAKKKKKDPAVISIENMFQGLGFARGEEMKVLVEKSREKFAEKFAEENKCSKKQGQKMAEKIIGTTFDVGHLNVFKKHGFTDEDLVEEAKKLKGYVKHIHLTDNFGYDDSHLPPGMGNVPIKDLMQAIEAGDLKARKIVEAGNFIQQFAAPAFSYNLEGMGSSMFTSGGPASYWGQSYFGQEGKSSEGLQRGYFGGYGGMLPQLNYETFGAGFMQLPSELGGQRMGGGQGSRMSGKPME